MTIRTAKQALADALSKKSNIVGACQAETRGYYLAPSAGDFDGDGASDAEDGWKREPTSARRFDRNGRAGYPASFLGGSHDNGHRAIFVARGIVRSTDFDGITKRYRAGIRGNGTVAEVERAMGVSYVGWSLTIDGQPIPGTRKQRLGWRVRKMIRLGENVQSKPGSRRSRIMDRINVLLKQIPKQ